MDANGFAALGVWVRHHGVEQVHACLEATGASGAALALSLYEAGHRVSIVNPARMAAYAKSRLARTKTDQVRYATSATSSPCWPPKSAPAARGLRRVERGQEMAQQEVNRRQSGIPSPAVLISIEATLAFLRAEIAKTQRLVQEQQERSAQLKQQELLLRSIPGVGAWTAALDRGAQWRRSTRFAARSMHASSQHMPA